MPKTMQVTMICTWLVVTGLLLTACGSEEQPQANPTTTAIGVTSGGSSADVLATAEAKFASGPEGTPTTVPSECPPISSADSRNATIHTPCLVELAGMNLYPTFRMTASGFKLGEKGNTEMRGPNGELVERNSSKGFIFVNQNGNVLMEDPMGGFPDHVTGYYTRTIEGIESGNKAVGHFYFKALPDLTPTPISGLPTLAEVKINTGVGHNTQESALKVTVPFRAEIQLASMGDAAYLSFKITAEQGSLLQDGVINASFTNPYLAQDGAVVVKLEPGYERNNEGFSTFKWKIGEWDESQYLLKVTATGSTVPANKPIMLEVVAEPE